MSHHHVLPIEHGIILAVGGESTVNNVCEGLYSGILFLPHYIPRKKEKRT